MCNRVELVRKKTEACVTAIVFGDDEAQQGIAPSVVDADGNRVEQFEPGLIAYLVRPLHISPSPAAEQLAAEIEELSSTFLPKPPSG